MGKQFFPKETIMASSSSAVTDTSKPTFDPSLYTSIANRLDYQYEISHVPEVSKIPIIDFLIVNAYIVFNKPQTSFKKTIKKKKKFIGPFHPSTIKEYVQASKFDRFNIQASENENFITFALPREFVIPWQKQCTHIFILMQ